MRKRYFPPWRTRYRRIELNSQELAALLTVAQYGAKYNYSQKGVYSLIATRKISAHKLPARKWGIVDQPPLQ